MLRLLRSLSRTASRFLKPRFKLCWLIPVHVADDERILRAIYSPYHLNKKKTALTHVAYEPTQKTDEVSMMRLEYLGVNWCKGKVIASPPKDPKKQYFGFAVLKVAAVREGGITVRDSRIHYCGHADIKYMMKELSQRVPHEPLPPELNKRFKDFKEHLVKASKYFKDPYPLSTDWRGDELQPPSAIQFFSDKKL